MKAKSILLLYAVLAWTGSHLVASVACSFDTNNPDRTGWVYILQRKLAGSAWPATPVEPVTGAGALVGLTSRASGAITVTRSAYTVTASADFFQATDVNRTITFGSGTNAPTAIIATFKDPRTVIVSVSGTIAATACTIATDRLELVDETVYGGQDWVYRVYGRRGTGAAAVETGKSGEVTVSIPVGAPSGVAIAINLGGLSNVSARARVGVDDDVLIVGFIANEPSRLLVRGIGPTLADYQVAGVLDDPQIELRDAATGTLLASNDDWSTAPDVESFTAAAHAFPLAASSRDAALALTVPAGRFTAIIRGANRGTGVALGEVYRLP